MDCKKCLLDIIGGKPYVSCNGCSRVFHTSCVELRQEYLYSISTTTNILWLCDECLHEFNAWKGVRNQMNAPSDGLKSNSMDTDIAELKEKVNAIMTTLSQFIPPSVTSAPSAPSTPTGSTAIAPKHSTPVPSLHLMSGTNAYCDSSHAANTCEHGCVPHCEPSNEERNFALLLTNIDGSVSENAVQEMVCHCLGASNKAECKSVKKLVSNGTDCSMLDYCSFKVVLNERWKPVAMSSATWPKDIKFREFVRRNRSWRPNV